MWELKKDFLDYARKDNKGYFYAKPDKEINLYKRNLYPIVWRGLLNDETVEIIQMNNSSDINNFEFKVYPEKFDFLKIEIVKYINQFLDYSMR